MRVDIISGSGIIEYKAVEIADTDPPIQFKKRFYPKDNVGIIYVGLIWDESVLEIEYADGQRYQFSYQFVRTPLASSNDELYELFKNLVKPDTFYTLDA